MAACGLIQATRSSLIQLRTDESWTGILQEADRLIVEVGISVQQERPTSTTSRNSKLDAFFVSSSFGQRSSTTRCPCDTLKIDMFFATINRMLSEFDRRFSDNIDVLKAASVFNPSCTENFLNPIHISTITSHYSSAGINNDTLDAQLAVAKSLLDCQPRRPDDIFEFRDILSRTSDAFTDLLKLVDIVLMLPVTTASNERMFSTLGRVKTYLRQCCGDERLSDLLVLSCLSESAKDLNLWNVVDNFAQLRSRRYPLIH